MWALFPLFVLSKIVLNWLTFVNAASAARRKEHGGTCLLCELLPFVATKSARRVVSRHRTRSIGRFRRRPTGVIVHQMCT